VRSVRNTATAAFSFFLAVVDYHYDDDDCDLQFARLFFHDVIVLDVADVDDRSQPSIRSV
jgi:hypothetical protein